ncbi:hypothetical protein [Azospirillum sp.]|uniref:alpha/beta hydrolase family esterase n=1 Tax=Azospirillum sp. TaxID=34012 RepID=UPI002D648A12|nr:hypothetical protein [Azospirillum sp.]HYD64856.1 hypothetical protein [Azospirillum sp.]
MFYLSGYSTSFARIDDVLPRAGAPSGCHRPPPDQPPESVEVGGVRRDIITAVPPAYDPDHPHRLVVAFHGRTNSNADVRRYFDLERHAGEPTIFVYPSGRMDGTIWTAPGDRPGNLRDVTLFDAVLTEITAAYCIDRDAVFVVGHSLGGWFANSLACARGAVIRGLATVGGGVTRAPRCSGPVAALVLHNPKDRQVPIAQGLSARTALREQNGLPPGSVPAEPDRFACRRYGAEDAANPVLWCPHHDDVAYNGRYYPHQWPRGAGAAAMAFFDRLDKRSPGIAEASGIGHNGEKSTP